jgi:hypothetical protein
MPGSGDSHGTVDDGDATDMGGLGGFGGAGAQAVPATTEPAARAGSAAPRGWVGPVVTAGLAVAASSMAPPAGAGRGDERYRRGHRVAARGRQLRVDQRHGDASAHRYYPSSSPSALAGAVAAIGKAAATCAFWLPTAPLDRSNIAVYLDQSLLREDPGNGWSLGVGSQAVVLNGGSCQKVLDGTAATVQVLFGCPGAPFPSLLP